MGYHNKFSVPVDEQGVSVAKRVHSTGASMAPITMGAAPGAVAGGWIHAKEGGGRACEKLRIPDPPDFSSCMLAEPGQLQQYWAPGTVEAQPPVPGPVRARSVPKGGIAS